MQEINYSVFDEVSGLLIYPLTDKLIRSMAEVGNESLSEVHARCKASIKESGINYFIKNGDKDIIPMTKKGALKCQGCYFDTYKEALDFIEGK